VEFPFAHCLPHLNSIENKKKVYESKILSYTIAVSSQETVSQNPKLQSAVAVFRVKKYK
jgi:hypothetical protein